MRDVIKRIIDKSDIPKYQKEYVIALFEYSFIQYYKYRKDTKFDTPELRDYWYYTKILLLSYMCDKSDRAYNLLSSELKKNAQKYLNNQFKIKILGEK